MESGLTSTSNNYCYLLKGKLNLITVASWEIWHLVPWNFHLAKPKVPDLKVRYPQSVLTIALTGCNAVLSSLLNLSEHRGKQSENSLFVL